MRRLTGATPTGPGRRGAWRRRPFVVGFLLGVAITLPAVFLALLVPGGDLLGRVLVPGAALLRPLSQAMATWPGALNLLLAAVGNGLVFGALAVCLALVRTRLRR